MQLRAVLFDLDGVLVKSEEPWFLTVEEAGRRFRGRPVTRAEFAPTFGQGTRADIRQFGLRCTEAELNEFYNENFPRFASHVWVNPQAVSVLRGLKERRLALALATNTVAPLAGTVVRAAGLDPHLDVLACASDVAHPKPAPDLLLHALERLGASAAEAVMVGDSRYDRDAARAANVRFVGLGLDGDERIDALDALPDVLFGDWRVRARAEPAKRTVRPIG